MSSNLSERHSRPDPIGELFGNRAVRFVSCDPWETPCHRRVTRQGQNHRRAFWVTTTRSSRRSGTSGTCRQRGRRSRRSTRERSGRARCRRRNHFKPLYVVSADKKDHVRDLKALLKDADELYLATDEDREGEAIAWHLLEVLKPEGPGQADGVPRDHPGGDPATPSTTRATSTAASSTPRRPAASSTASTATRSRRSCGSKVSRGCRPVGSRASRPAWSSSVSASAWRSVAAGYWDLDGRFATPAGQRPAQFTGDARRSSTARAWPRGKDFDADGRLTLATDGGVAAARRAAAPAARRATLGDRPFDGALGRATSRTPRSRYAPFMTSTLQQEAGRKLRLSRRAGDVARPEPVRGAASSPTCGPTRRRCPTRRSTRPAPRSLERYGADYLPDEPRTYANKVKNAQEAHEAIRPAGDRFRTPDEVSGQLNAPELPPLRADLAAHGRVPDDRRPGRVGPGPPRCTPTSDDREAVLRSVGPDDPVPRLPPCLCRRLRRPGRGPRRPGTRAAEHGRG